MTCNRPAGLGIRFHSSQVEKPGYEVVQVEDFSWILSWDILVSYSGFPITEHTITRPCAALLKRY